MTDSYRTHSVSPPAGGTMRFNGVLYDLQGRLDITVENGHPRFEPYFPSGHTRLFEVVDKCDHCQRFDTRPIVWHSWDEVLAAGFATPHGEAPA